MMNKELKMNHKNNLYEIKDDLNDTLYEVRERKTDIDQSLDFDTITNI